MLSCKYVDDVFPENNWEQKRSDIIKYGASIFGIGDDWKGKFDELSDICEVIYLERTESVSTTDIKKLSKISSQECEQLEASLHAALNIIKTVKKHFNMLEEFMINKIKFFLDKFPMIKKRCFLIYRILSVG